MNLAVDVANFTVIPTPGQVDALVALGVTRAIVGTSYGGVGAAQIAALEAGGITCQEYQFPNVPRPAIRPFWADCEGPGATQPAIRAAMRAGAIGPYSRRGFFADNFPDWDFQAEFPAAQLFDARYIGTVNHGTSDPCLIANAVASGGDIAAAVAAEYALLPPFVPYAGFSRAAVTQWHNSITIYGMNVDLDIVEDEAMTPADKQLVANVLNFAIDVNTRLSVVTAAFIDHASKAIPGATDPAVLATLQKEIDDLGAKMQTAAKALS